MIKLGQLQPGDIVMVNDEGLMREGTVVHTNAEEHMALVDNGIQEFWYAPQDIFPVALDEEQLLKLGFTKEPLDGVAVKYKKGVFRLVTPVAGDFSDKCRTMSFAAQLQGAIAFAASVFVMAD